MLTFVGLPLAGAAGVGLLSFLFTATRATPRQNAVQSAGTSTPGNDVTNGPVPPPKSPLTMPPVVTIDPSKQYVAVIKTTEGDLTANLFPKDAPITVNNFVFLANQGFYENVKFHRIIKGFMVQTGDPTGTGAGGPGYYFIDEPVKRKYLRGTLAMANSGPNTNGSQFFIMHQDYPLQPNYTIFGQVTIGLDVLDKLANAPVTAGPGGEASLPLKDLRIVSVTISDK
jgi:cyclophilin family peptidyl-prolyl cis-trans isomerase